MTEHRTDYQRRRILSALADGALSARDLAGRLYLTKEAILRHLAPMRAERLVHVAAYRKTGARPTPLYGAGNRKDTIYVRTRAPKGRITGEQQHVRILKMLAKEPLSAVELSERLHIKRAGIHITALRKDRRIFVARWEKNERGYPTPIYAVGGDPDVPRPPGLTEREKRQRAWARLKADPARHAIYRTIARVRNKPQNPFSALGL